MIKSEHINEFEKIVITFLSGVAALIKESNPKIDTNNLQLRLSFINSCNLMYSLCHNHKVLNNKLTFYDILGIKRFMGKQIPTNPKHIIYNEFIPNALIGILNKLNEIYKQSGQLNYVDICYRKNFFCLELYDIENKFIDVVDIRLLEQLLNK